MENLKSFLKNHCFTKRGRAGLNNRTYTPDWWKNKGFLNYYQKILEHTVKLNEYKPSIAERVYCIMENLEDRPVCKHCNKEKVNFKSFSKGYYSYCSNYCLTQSSDRNDKISIGVLSKIDSTIKKGKLTNLKRYGVEWTTQLPSMMQKTKNTKMNRYGDSSFSNMEKNRKTCMEKYGVETLFALPDHQEKMKISRIKKYGTSIPTPNFVSGAETEILQYINGLGFNFENNRKILLNSELDGYDDNIKTAIEYCGLYWHSEQYKKPDYHYEKLLKCREKNIRLITIFEDEWIHRKEQVKEYLKSTLGIFDKRIYARNCAFSELYDPNFFEKNHIQGKPNSIDFCYSLIYNDSIVGQVSFAKHHRNNNILTLNRLSFTSGIQCIGGASKLIKNALQYLKRDVITWSDNRWTEGLLYEKCGFVFDGELKPDYSYVMKDQKRKTKQSSKKNILGIPDDITEHQWHLDNKIYRIYDCGKKRWKYLHN